MTEMPPARGPYVRSGSSFTADTSEGGSKRTRLRGYLKAANELRQTYQQQYVPGWSNAESWTDRPEDGSANAYPDLAVVRSGREEMVLFPSYARKHVKIKPKAQSGMVQEQPGESRPVHDAAGEGNAEYWKQKWEEYEDDNAVVDVDVRGWVFSPHNGQMTRKQRIFISLARQLAGLPAPVPASPQRSPLSSRPSSPHPHRQRIEQRSAIHEEELAAEEAKKIVQRGQARAEAAGRGEYSEAQIKDVDSDALSNHASSSSSSSSVISREPTDSTDLRRIAVSNAAHGDDDPKITPLQKRASWSHPSEMNTKEVAVANAHLMARLQPFISNPLAETPISAFFYNDDISRQRTIYTNSFGHFALRAALDFVPTHVRILASEHLSATEEVIITEPNGVSLISDIDDTIKHSAIGSGAREIFRNAFIRDLGDLTIEGVQEWYTKLAKMGVKFHYVSNSPWQLYPVITKFFAEAGLPLGSFHLKQYSGMLQGIFEPVAERKKSTLDRIAADFPERRFILVGDSGEADLEVYLDFVRENPGRVLGIFIRDVTTSANKGGFFDSSMGPITGPKSGMGPKGFGSVNNSETASSEEDSDLDAAIAASLQDLRSDEERNRPSLPPRNSTYPKAAISQESEKLIDLSDDDATEDGRRPPRRPPYVKAQISSNRDPIPSTSIKKSIPPVPLKPILLRSGSGLMQKDAESLPKKPPNPPPPRGSTMSSRASPSASDPPPPIPNSSKPVDSMSYASLAKTTLASAYNHVPAAPSVWGSRNQVDKSEILGTVDGAYSRHEESNDGPSTSNKTILPPPPRRTVSSYPAAAASYATSRVTNAWNGTSQFNASQSQLSGGQRFSTSTASGGGGQPPNKREELWRVRWARAEQMLKEKNVVLKTWREGTDVLEESVKLVERAGKEDAKARDQRSLKQKNTI